MTTIIKPERRWVEICNTQISDDSHIVFFRSKQPRGEHPPGYGYFALLKTPYDGKTFEVKLPMKLITHMKQKLTEYAVNTNYVTPFPTDEGTFTLCHMPNIAPGKDVQLQIRNKKQQHALINMTMKDCQKMTKCMEVLGILMGSQKDRMPADEYHAYVEDVMGWLTAKKAFEEVKKMLSGSEPANREQFETQWGNILVNRYIPFHNDLESFMHNIKRRIPIDDPNTVSYNDKYVSNGFEYTYPFFEWSPEQMLVAMMHDSFPDPSLN